MSFTQEVKQEIINLKTIETEKISELSAIIHNSVIENNSIKIISENNSVIRYVFSLIKDIYKITPKVTVRKGYNYKKNYIYILEINNKSSEILIDLGIEKDNEILSVPQKYIVDDESLLREYLKGVFLITGSINDPKKSRYHLEFLVNKYEYAEFLKEILNKFYLNSKILKRENKYMIYITEAELPDYYISYKEAEKIGDFLRIINATKCLLYYEDIRIYRDHKNMTNRLNNCEQANVEKIINVANNQLEDIKTIKEAGGLELLDEKEQIVAQYRLKYVDASLLELSEIITLETGKAITKSGVNHRMKKIKLLAERIRKNEK